MTTWTIQTAAPAAGTGTSGEAAYTDSGLRVDDTVTSTGTNKALFDTITGSTVAIKMGKYMMHLQKFDGNGRAYRAFDGGVTYVYPTY